MAEGRETALVQRGYVAKSFWMEHTNALAMPKVGDHVMVQNQTGKRGMLMKKEVHDHYQVDGSRILTRGDRKFLMLFTLIQSRDVRTNLPRASISDAANSATTEVNIDHGEVSFL